MKKSFILLGSITLLSLSFNTVADTVTSKNCPEKFIGKVRKINDTDLYSQFPKIEVEFEVSDSLKGVTTDTKTFRVVKDGPYEFRVGKTYKVDSNGKYLCGSQETKTI